MDQSKSNLNETIIDDRLPEVCSPTEDQSIKTQENGSFNGYHMPKNSNSMDKSDVANEVEVTAGEQLPDSVIVIKPEVVMLFLNK